MVVGRGIQAKRFAEFLFRSLQLLLLEQSHTEKVVGEIRIRVERNGQAQFAKGRFRFVSYSLK